MCNVASLVQSDDVHYDNNERHNLGRRASPQKKNLGRCEGVMTMHMRLCIGNQKRHVTTLVHQ